MQVPRLARSDLLASEESIGRFSKRFRKKISASSLHFPPPLKVRVDKVRRERNEATKASGVSVFFVSELGFVHNWPD